MNHKHLSELLDYHYWAQERVFDAVESLSAEQFTRDMGNSFSSVRDTLAHIHFAECLWYARWLNEPLPKPSPETFLDLESLRQASKTHEVKMRALLERLGDDGIHQSTEYTSLLDGKDHDSLLAGDSGGMVMRETLEWLDAWLANRSGSRGEGEHDSTRHPSGELIHTNVRE